MAGWTGTDERSLPYGAAVEGGQRVVWVAVRRGGPAFSGSARPMPPDRSATQGTPAFPAASMAHTVSPTDTAWSAGTPACSRARATRSGARLLAETSSLPVASAMTSSASRAARITASSLPSAEVARTIRKPRGPPRAAGRRHRPEGRRGAVGAVQRLVGVADRVVLGTVAPLRRECRPCRTARRARHRPLIWPLLPPGYRSGSRQSRYPRPPRTDAHRLLRGRNPAGTRRMGSGALGR